MVTHGKNETLGERVKRIRNEKWLTQVQLAEEIDVSVISLVKIERWTTKHPNFLTMVNISEALGTDINQFIAVLDRSPHKAKRTHANIIPTGDSTLDLKT